MKGAVVRTLADEFGIDPYRIHLRKLLLNVSSYDGVGDS